MDVAGRCTLLRSATGAATLSLTSRTSVFGRTHKLIAGIHSSLALSACLQSRQDHKEEVVAKGLRAMAALVILREKSY